VRGFSFLLSAESSRRIFLGWSESLQGRNNVAVFVESLAARESDELEMIEHDQQMQ
jgi:hypothetical protein